MMYNVPSIAALSLSALIFYKMRRYLIDFDRLARNPAGELYGPDLTLFPARVNIPIAVAFVLFCIGIMLFPHPL